MKLILASLVLFVSFGVQAATLKIEGSQRLVGNYRIAIHLVILDDGSMIAYAGRSMPRNVSIVISVDHRETDGALGVQLSDGTKLV